MKSATCKMQIVVGTLEEGKFIRTGQQNHQYPSKVEAVKELKDKIMKKVQEGYLIAEGEKVKEDSHTPKNSQQESASKNSISVYQRSLIKKAPSRVMSNPSNEAGGSQLGKRPLNIQEEGNAGDSQVRKRLLLDDTDQPGDDSQPPRSAKYASVGKDKNPENQTFSPKFNMTPVKEVDTQKEEIIENLQPVPQCIFLTPKEQRQIFMRKAPKSLQKIVSEGSYLERKVKGSKIWEMDESKSEEIFTEYYSLQVHSSYCYFEYGIVEETHFLKYQMHETVEVVEAMSLLNELRKKRILIGFIEKNDKLVKSLNTNLIKNIKKKKTCYQYHEGKMSTQKSVKKIISNLGRDSDTSEQEEIDLASGSKDEDKNDMVPEESPQNEANDKYKIQKEEDINPKINVYEDIGQSDIKLIYDNLSHSNPCFTSQLGNDDQTKPINFGEVNLEERTKEMLEFQQNLGQDGSKATQLFNNMHPLGPVIDEPLPLKFPEKYRENFNIKGKIRFDLILKIFRDICE